MARTKTTSIPPPKVDYKALYPWASVELLTEFSTLTSSEDVRKHRDGEPDCVGRVFKRESEDHVSVRPCAKRKPVCSNERTLLDDFTLYWVRKLGFKKPRTLEDLTPYDREFCQVLTSLGEVFNTVQMIKHEYDIEALKGYIGIVFTPSCMVVPVIILLCLHTLPLCICMFTPMF